jgi:hypothetical protein
MKNNGYMKFYFIVIEFIEKLKLFLKNKQKKQMFQIKKKCFILNQCL